jgi:DNA-binding NtrC family response regulator
MRGPTIYVVIHAEFRQESRMQTHPLSGVTMLIVDDDILLRKLLGAALERLGADVSSAGSIEVTRRMIADFSFDFVLLDVNLPDGKGTDMLAAREFAPSTGVIVMTSEGAIAGAVEAMRLGALDYLAKPFDPAELPLVISRARKAKQAARADEHRRSEAPDFYFGTALGPLETQLQKILSADERMQGPLPPVLIHGETGTGKTTIARWLHHRGPRSGQPLVEVNCSALPETLAESELFGHERGAFTDARTARMGLFEAANGGTLFLDELPSLSPGLQAKVLMAIEDRRIRRVGGNRELSVDVRVVAATNSDLKQLVARGQFREDLYHRLDLFRLLLPPLRTRGADILRLAEQMIDRLCRRYRMPRKRISNDGQQRLLGHAWPGNVRELAHELERAIVFEEGEELHLEQLPLPMTVQPEEAQGQPCQGEDWFNTRYSFPASGFALEGAIHRLIQHALDQTHGNVSAAARVLGVTRDYLRYRLGGQKPEGT